MPVVLSDHHRRCILLVALAYLCVLLHGPSYAVSAESLFIDKVTYYEPGVSEAAEPGPMPTIWNWTAPRSRHLTPGGGRASAPSLRPMPSCTTTSSPHAAGKRPTRKSCAAESANRRCSCSAGRSSSLTVTRGSDRTYPPTVSISRSKAMVFRKCLTFFRYELGRKQRWTTY